MPNNPEKSNDERPHCCMENACLQLKKPPCNCNSDTDTSGARNLEPRNFKRVHTIKMAIKFPGKHGSQLVFEPSVSDLEQTHKKAKAFCHGRQRTDIWKWLTQIFNKNYMRQSQEALSGIKTASQKEHRFHFFLAQSLTRGTDWERIAWFKT